MEEINPKHASLSSSNIETINGVRFTPREVDILSCILKGRSARRIASFLSLSPRTIEYYIHNIIQKLECNSREGIIDFLERSDQAGELDDHFANLQQSKTFEGQLKTANEQTRFNPPSCQIVYWKNEKDILSLVSLLVKHIESAGIILSTEGLEELSAVSTSDKQMNDSKTDFVIYLIPKKLGIDPRLIELINQHHPFKLEDMKPETATYTHVLIQQRQQDVWAEYTLPSGIINTSELRRLYYSGIASILTTILPMSNFEDSQLKASSPITENSTTLEKSKKSSSNPIFLNSSFNEMIFALKTLKKRNLLYLAGLLIILIYLPVMFGFPFLSDQSKYSIKRLVRSDLVIPVDTKRLNRTELNNKIDSALKNQIGIRTIALAGIGGAGKTTLARQYAHSKRASITWEISSESPDNINSSLETLAEKLAISPEEAKALKEIQAIKNHEKKHLNILLFVKDKLRDNSRWILIFDNVEKFSDIQTVFPSDPELWGHGTVIITTRDSQISQNSQIKASLQITALTPSEKWDLFTKIIVDDATSPSRALNVEETKAFLENLPPFPLDISVAAYYIKATHISYREYLENLTNQASSFTNTQEHLLKEASNYTKTRYQIITNSLKQVIATNPNFTELLLFISLLDSQNISRDLLNNFKQKLIVDSFFYHLKKYSLLNAEENFGSDGNSFSIHRSTQKIILAYLLNTLPLENRNTSIKSISKSLANYIIDAVNKEDSIKINSLVSHILIFLGSENLIPNTDRLIINGELGVMYYYQNRYIISKTNLEDNIKLLYKMKIIDYPRIARLSVYLGNVYFNLGNYEKSNELYERSLEIYKKHNPIDYKEFAKALTHLGSLYKVLGNYNKSKDILEESLALYQKHLPQNYNDIARTLTNLGSLYLILGELSKSKEILHRSLGILEKHFPESHPEIPLTLIQLGNINRTLGSYNEAKKHLERGLRIYQKDFSGNYNYIARISFHLGNIYRKLGEYKMAHSLIQSSLQTYQKHFPAGYVESSWSFAHLGILYNDIGNYEKANDLLEKSLVIFRKKFPEHHIEISWALAHLGVVHREMGKYESAVNLLEKSLANYEKYLPSNHVGAPWVLMHLGNTYCEMGDYERARTLLEKSVKLHTNIFKPDNIRLAWVSAQLGNLYIQLGNFEKAKAIIEKSLQAHQRDFEKDHLKIAWMKSRLGIINKELGQMKIAKQYFDEALISFDTNSYENHYERARVLTNLGELYLLEGNIEMAESYLNKALKIYQQQNHPNIYIALIALADLNEMKANKASKMNRDYQQNLYHRQAIDNLNQALSILKANFSSKSSLIFKTESRNKKFQGELDGNP